MARFCNNCGKLTCQPCNCQQPVIVWDQHDEQATREANAGGRSRSTIKRTKRSYQPKPTE